MKQAALSWPLCPLVRKTQIRSHRLIASLTPDLSPDVSPDLHAGLSISSAFPNSGILHEYKDPPLFQSQSQSQSESESECQSESESESLPYPSQTAHDHQDDIDNASKVEDREVELAISFFNSISNSNATSTSKAYSDQYQVLGSDYHLNWDVTSKKTTGGFELDGERSGRDFPGQASRLVNVAAHL